MTLVRRIGRDQVHAGVTRTLALAAVPDIVPAVDAGAVERGYQEGLAAGRAEALAERDGLVAEWRQEVEATLLLGKAELDQASDRYADAMARLCREIEDDRLWAESLAVEVAFATVTRWLGEHRLDERVLEQFCTEIMRSHPGSAFTVRISAADAAALATVGTALTLVPDASLAPGELTLESTRGGFDAGIRARLDAVRDALLAGLEGASRRG